MKGITHGYEDLRCCLSLFDGFGSKGTSAKNCGRYIDDITIFSPTLEQHLEDVNRVMERLSIANLKVNVNKCAFAREEVVVLGFKVLKAGINFNLEKV